MTSFPKEGKDVEIQYLLHVVRVHCGLGGGNPDLVAGLVIDAIQLLEEGHALFVELVLSGEVHINSGNRHRHRFGDDCQLLQGLMMMMMMCIVRATTGAMMPKTDYDHSYDQGDDYDDDESGTAQCYYLHTNKPNNPGIGPNPRVLI